MKEKREFSSLPKLSQLERELSRERYRQRYHWVLRSTIYILITVAAVAVLVATLWMPVLQIYGSSMSPTLSDGEIVVSVKSADMETGELIAFYYGNKLLIKRCIAGPGDWVNITGDGTVYVNDVALDEPYLEEKAYGECDIDLPYQVPEARYFLMGDNRAISVDSRTTTVGCVAEDQIVGRIVFRVWPLPVFGEL